MDFTIPKEITDLLAQIDAFIEREIMPLQEPGRQRSLLRSSPRMGAHRFRAWRVCRARIGKHLLREMRVRADKAGFLRLALPEEFGGKNIGNLAMAIIREHLAAKGLGLHNDLQNETSVVGNFPQILMFRDFGTDEQKKTLLPGNAEGKVRIAFRPYRTQAWFGRDMDGDARRARKAMAGASMARRCGIRACMWPRMTWCSAARRGDDGDARGLTCLIVPMNAEGVKIEEYMWTFNMPTDHARVSFKNVWVPDSAVFGPVDNGLVLARHFVHENRIRQAACGVGAAQYCINESIDYANYAQTFRQAAVAQPGDPVAARRIADGSRDGALADLSHGVGDGSHDRAGNPALSLRQGLDVQLSWQSAGLRRGRLGDAGAWRHGLFAPQAVRAYLSPSSALSHHRRFGRNPECATWRATCSASSARTGPAMVSTNSPPR